VKLLFDIGKVEVDSKDENGRTPLSRAALYRHEAVVKLLLEQGASTDIEDRGRLTVLQLAAFNKQENIEQLLVTQGAFIPEDFYGLQTLFS
jgi:ankyrin repeat protein